MSSVSGVSDTAANNTGSTGSNSTSRKEPKKTLGKDDYLQLFITQLVHQNPLEPLDNESFISQMAQFTAIEQATNTSTTLVKLQELQEENNELLSMLLYNQVSTANKLMYESASLIGRTVIAQTGEEAPVQGVVARVNLNEGQVEIQLESGHTFLATEVIEISA